MKKHLALCIAFLTLITLSAQNKPSEFQNTNIPLDEEIKKGVLENGLTYAIRKNSKPADKLELRLIVKVGAIDEDDDQLGLAHIMEHMNFNGTKNFKKNELVDYLQSIGVKFGADLNAYTNQNETVYKLSIPADDEEKVAKAFQILEDWAHNALLEPEEIDAERGIVLEEYRKRLGARQRIRNQWIPILLKDSKYAHRNVIGTEERILNFSHQRLKDFYNDWYRPDLMSVVVVGDLDVAMVEKKIIHHFSKITNPTTPRIKEQHTIPNHDDIKIAILTDKELVASSISITYKDLLPSDPVTTTANAKEKIIQNLFSKMINNRLQDLAHGETPPFAKAYAGRSKYFVPRQRAYFCGASMDDTQIKKALETIFVENERIKRHGFLKSELERAKKLTLSLSEKSAKETGKKNSKSYTRSLLSSELSGNTPSSTTWNNQFHKEILPAITLKDVNSLMSQYLHKNNSTILITAPERSEAQLPTENDIQSLLANVEQRTIMPWKEQELSNELLAELPKKGTISKITKDTLYDITTLELSNGAKVLYKKTDFKNDEIILKGFSYGGYSLYSDQDYINTFFARAGLKEAGLGGFSTNDLKKMLTGKLARVRTSVSDYKETIRGNSSPKDLQTLFELLYLNFTALNMNTAAYKAFKSKFKNIALQQLSSPGRFFNYKLQEFREHDNPRFIPFPTAERIDASDYPLAWKKFQERFANAGDFTFVFVGSIDEKILKSHIETYIASLPSTPQKEKYIPTEYRPTNMDKELVVRKGLEEKAQIRISFEGEAPTFEHKEQRALNYLGAILKIKLTEKLREEKSSIYNSRVVSGVQRIPYPKYYLNIDFSCAPQKVEELKIIALEELQKILTHGPEQKDLNKVKEKKLLQLKESQESNAKWANKISNAAFWNHTIKPIEEEKASITAVPADYIQEIGKKYLQRTPMTAILLPE